MQTQLSALSIQLVPNTVTHKSHLTLDSCKGLVALAKNPEAVKDMNVKFKDLKDQLWTLYGEILADRIRVPNHIPAAKKQDATAKLLDAVRIVAKAAQVAYRMKVREYQRDMTQRRAGKGSRPRPVAPTEYKRPEPRPVEQVAATIPAAAEEQAVLPLEDAAAGVLPMADTFDWLAQQ